MEEPGERVVEALAALGTRPASLAVFDLLFELVRGAPRRSRRCSMG